MRGDDELAALWDAETDPHALIALLARIDHATTVVTLARCARAAVASLPSDELRPIAAIETAEAWTRGEATVTAVQKASRAAFQAEKTAPRRAQGLPPFGPGGIAAVRAAGNVGLAVFDYAAQATLECAVVALANEAAGANPAPEDGEFDSAARSELATVIRGAAPRPRLDRLLAWSGLIPASSTGLDGEQD